jgi:hypothetical protein
MRLMQRWLWSSFVIVMLTCARAAAQPAPPKPSGAGGPAWEVEAHGGGLVSSTPKSGTFGLPAAGPLVPPSFNRPVSSWYFGDGSFQVNQFPNVRLTGILAPLDGTLQSRVVTRKSGGVFGVRLARRMTSRISAELNVDYAMGPLAFSGDATSAMEVARASFITAFNGLFVSPFIASRIVNSALALTDEEGSQLLTTGAVRFNLLNARDWAPYVVAGVGALSVLGDAPRAVLTGTYQAVFSVPGFPVPPSTMTQTDAVTVTSSVDSGAVWVLGGGVRLSMSERWGLRIDVRDHLHGNTLTTRVSATPLLPPSSFGTYVTTTFNNPPLVFSGSPLTPSTLSVPLTDFVTFSGTGVVHQVGITTGFSWQF